MIMPELEQGPLFNQINFSVKIQIQDPTQATNRRALVGTFLCPSDNMPRSWTASAGFMSVNGGVIEELLYPICDVAGANDVGVYGIGEPGVAGEGIFFRNTSVRFSEITDGLSQTLLVGERSIQMIKGRGQATWVGAVAGADRRSEAKTKWNRTRVDAGRAFEPDILQPERRRQASQPDLQACSEFPRSDWPHFKHAPSRLCRCR
jgi:hypothetical protein